MVRWDTGNGASLPSDKFPGTLAQEMQKAINLCMLESMLGHRYLHCRSWWFCGCWGVLCRGSVCPCDKSPMRTLRHSSTYFLPVWHTVGTCCAGVSGISWFFFFPDQSSYKMWHLQDVRTPQLFLWEVQVTDMKESLLLCSLGGTKG